jgi:hypothetical protein
MWFQKYFLGALDNTKVRSCVIPFEPVNDSKLSMHDAMLKIESQQVVDPDRRYDALWCPYGAKMSKVVRESVYNVGCSAEDNAGGLFIRHNGRGLHISDFYSPLCSFDELQTFLDELSTYL